MTNYPAGYVVISIQDASRSRPILIDAWYPAAADAEKPFDYKPGLGRVAENAAVVDAVLPLIVLSHGAFGAARNYSWIAEHLARAGYIVAGVSHFGESFVYGPARIDPKYALQPWHRPLDCAFVLDYLLGQSRFKAVADPARIGGLGHSSGGATVMELAGARLDLAAMQRYCRSEEGRMDKGCQYAAGVVSPTPQMAEAGRSFKDDRVKAIVALDPALGPGHTAESLSSITVPVHVVGAVENDFLPYESHAARYARIIPGAEHTRLTSGEGHFVFLDECKTDTEANGVPLCKDREGVQRGAVHGRLAETIQRFFDLHLKGDRPGLG